MKNLPAIIYYLLQRQLSGAARIHCKEFRNELARYCQTGPEPIIGGDMEGVGLLSVSPPDDPLWIIVKAISDFADENRDEVILKNRQMACRHAAKFVLDTFES